MTYDIRSSKDLMAKLGIYPNKKLGQNFLINKETCQKIVDSVKGETQLVEIGPGLGALTELILETNIPLKLIELDRTLAEYWKSKATNIIHGDALKIDWDELDLYEACLISNLPYQISSRIVVDRSLNPAGISTMVLMFQKEVAMRMRAAKKTKDYGALSVIAQTFWSIRKLLEVGPKDFYPPPQIASRVLVFKKKDNPVTAPYKFLKFVKTAFAQRRKLLKKNLASYGHLPIKDKARAEDLTPKEYVELFFQIGPDKL